MCCTDKGSLPQSVSWWWWGDLSIYNEGLSAILERMGRFVCSSGLPNNAMSAPKLANFLVHFSGLAWFVIQWVFIILLFQLFWEAHHHHKASNHHISSKLMHHFYLEYLPSHKHLNPWDVEQLSLLDSWALVSSLTNFILSWMIATLLALITAKQCSDLTFLCIDNQHLFPSVSCCYFHSHMWWKDRSTGSYSSSDSY